MNFRSLLINSILEFLRISILNKHLQAYFKAKEIEVCRISYLLLAVAMRIGTIEILLFFIFHLKDQLAQRKPHISSPSHRIARFVNPYQKHSLAKAPAALETRRHRFPSPALSAFRLLALL